MGNSTSSKLSKEILEDLKLNTKFSQTEISLWYENFQKQCPSGRITPAEFEQIYARFFPDSDTAGYARHVFRSFDTNDDGTLDFKEYIIALHMTSSERLAEGEFIQGVIENQNAVRLIFYEPVKQ